MKYPDEIERGYDLKQLLAFLITCRDIAGVRCRFVENATCLGVQTDDRDWYGAAF